MGWRAVTRDSDAAAAVPHIGGRGAAHLQQELRGQPPRDLLRPLKWTAASECCVISVMGERFSECDS